MSEDEAVGCIKIKILAMRVDSMDKQLDTFGTKIDKLTEVIYAQHDQLLLLGEDRSNKKDRIRYVLYPLILAIIINLPNIIKLFQK